MTWRLGKSTTQSWKTRCQSKNFRLSRMSSQGQTRRASEAQVGTNKETHQSAVTPHFRRDVTRQRGNYDSHTPGRYTLPGYNFDAWWRWGAGVILAMIVLRQQMVWTSKGPPQDVNNMLAMVSLGSELKYFNAPMEPKPSNPKLANRCPNVPTD